MVYVEQLTSALYLDKREDIDHTRTPWSASALEANPPGQTGDMMASILKQLTD